MTSTSLIQTAYEYIRGQNEGLAVSLKKIWASYSRSCFIAVTNNNTMLKILETHASKLVLYSTINYKITPHEPHYSGNKVNQSVYDALLAEDYERIRTIFEEADTYNRERILRSGRI